MSIATPHAATKQLQAYYRDTLSLTFSFGDIGRMPQQLVFSAVVPEAVDLAGLRAHFEKNGATGLSAEHDRALKLMLELIVFTNRVLQQNNPSGQKLPANDIAAVKQGLNEVLSLAPIVPYMENTVRLLVRLNEIDEAVGFALANWQFLSNSGPVRHIIGFIATMEGEYQKALDLLEPLRTPELKKQFPFTDLCCLSAEYALGKWPQVPVRFDSVQERHQSVDFTDTRLPALQWLREFSRRDRIVMFVACDEVYFYEHVLRLAYALHRTDAETFALHVHLYSPNKSVRADVERLAERVPGLELAVSFEEIPRTYAHHPNIYYSCVRFLRLYELQQHYGIPICLVDADTLLRNNWKSFREKMGITEKTDVALLYRDYAPPWERVVAGFLYVAPSEEGRAFVADVAAFVADNFARDSVRWFLDQIALGAVYEKYYKGKPAFLPVPLTEAFDLTHRPDSFLWTVTNFKNASSEYNRYREELSAAYHTAPSASPDHFYRVLSERQEVFFLQVGVMDGSSYDPIFPYIRRYGWKGILVEPLPDMIARAKKNYGEQAGLIFENIAISQKEETRVIYRVRPEAAQAANLPTWVLGMSSFVPDKLADYREHVVEEPVTCLPLATMLAKHAPERIDVLQIDTEGYDFKIFQQFDFLKYQPFIINLEFVHLPAEEKSRLQDILLEHGYVFFRNDLDLFAVKRELMFPA